jgi:hypothetical protein
MMSEKIEITIDQLKNLFEYALSSDEFESASLHKPELKVLLVHLNTRPALEKRVAELEATLQEIVDGGQWGPEGYQHENALKIAAEVLAKGKE